MAIVTFDRDLSVSAVAAWDVLADFEGFLNWAVGGPDGGATIEIVGEAGADGIGVIRRMNIPGIGIIGERLIRREPENKLLSYEICEGKPLGMDTYIAVVTLSENDNGTCHIDWKGDMTAVAGADESQVAQSLQGSFVGMTDALEGFVKG
jgi:hypothetical protein